MPERIYTYKQNLLLFLEDYLNFSVTSIGWLFRRSKTFIILSRRGELGIAPNWVIRCFRPIFYHDSYMKVTNTVPSPFLPIFTVHTYLKAFFIAPESNALKQHIKAFNNDPSRRIHSENKGYLTRTCSYCYPGANTLYIPSPNIN